MEHYLELMKDWQFTKNGAEYPKYYIGGLHYRSEYTLSTVARMSVKETVIINGYALTRIK